MTFINDHSIQMPANRSRALLPEIAMILLMFMVA